MPQFVPIHTPAGLDAFTAGYMDAMEWLLPEEYGGNGVSTPDRMTGFARSTLVKAKRECAAFQVENAELLGRFCELTGKNLDSAGHDFFLTRNRHGTGFWDRGTGDVGDALSEACRKYSETYEFLSSRGKLISE